MYTFITILAVVVSLILILIVLVQNSKGGGLSSGFSSSNQIMGVRKTTDFLEKATWSLAAALLVFSIATAAFVPHSKMMQESELKKTMQQQSATTPSVTQPGFDVQPTAPGDSTKK